jgi:hypothetical protein
MAELPFNIPQSLRSFNERFEKILRAASVSKARNQNEKMARRPMRINDSTTPKIRGRVARPLLECPSEVGYFSIPQQRCDLLQIH